MNKTIIPVLALLATTVTGAAHAAEPMRTALLQQVQRVEAKQMEQGAAEREYARLLANYRKDLAAYQADPTIWTAEVPVMPVKPAQLRK